MCGYPFSVETPRLARGLISGYELYVNAAGDGFPVPSLVLDASVNFGNSGGPICDKEGRVVGVICAQRTQQLLHPDVARLPQDQQDFFELLLRFLPIGTGIGYALDPLYVRHMLDALDVMPPGARSPHRKYPPKIVSMRRSDFAALQAAAATAERRPANTSPIGAFSFTPDGEYYLGWYDKPDRVPLPRNAAWATIAPAISRTGGSFFLRGYDVHLYRRTYHGYTVPVRIEIGG